MITLTYKPAALIDRLKQAKANSQTAASDKDFVTISELLNFTLNEPCEYISLPLETVWLINRWYEYTLN